MKQSELLSLLTDRQSYIENLVRIVDKDRNLVPFTLNPTQRHYEAHHTNRDIICKARQLGFTSFIMAKFLVDCMLVPGTVSMVISHKEYIAKRFLAKAKAFYDSIEETQFKPELHHKSGHELSFRETGSIFYIGSAQAEIEERGDTIHNFLGSEVSRWPDPKRILDAIEESVPITGWLVLESTPWGEGNLFHDYWMASREKRSVYTGHFYPWWWGEDYAILEGSDLALPADRGELELTADERALIDSHGLTIDQIRWRRRKLSERKDEFWQEYPEDPVSCFYTTAKAVFDLDRLAQIARACKAAPYRYEGAKVWHRPEEGERYVIGADPTEGQRDPAAATVWKLGEHPVHCATYCQVIDPIPFGHYLDKLGRYYNNALLAVELNGPGLTVLSVLTGYRPLYYATDPSTNRRSSKPGWRTTVGTKSYAIATLQNLLPEIEISDIEIVQQARNMRFVDPKDMGSRRRWGKLPLKVISTGNDDIIMSAVIALGAIDTVPRVERGVMGYAQGWNW